MGEVVRVLVSFWFQWQRVHDHISTVDIPIDEHVSPHENGQKPGVHSFICAVQDFLHNYWFSFTRAVELVVFDGDLFRPFNWFTMVVDPICLKDPSRTPSNSISRKFGEDFYRAILSHCVVDRSHCHLITERGELFIVLQLHGGVPTQINGRTERQWDDQFHPFERLLQPKVRDDAKSRNET